MCGCMAYSLLGSSPSRGRRSNFVAYAVDGPAHAPGACIAGAAAASPRGATPRPVLFAGARVVNPGDGTCSEPMDILVRNGRIAGVSPAGSTLEAADADRISVDGKYVTPGFLDMHVHTLTMPEPESAFELMLANGVTGFRQMGGAFALLAARKTDDLPIPAASPALLAMPGEVLLPTNAGTPEMAVATVRAQHQAGADFIKVGVVTPQAFFAAQAEAQSLGIPIVGHLPIGIEVVAVSQGGMKSIEHLGPGVGILAACSSDEAGVRAALAKRPALPGGMLLRLPFAARLLAPLLQRLLINPAVMSRPEDIEILAHAIDTFDEAKCRDLAERFAADGTWQSPTLIRLKTQELCDATEFSQSPDLRYMQPSTLKQWASVTNSFRKLPERTRTTLAKAYALQLRVTKLFADAGVKMIASSDVGGAGWEIPGCSLHREFDELERAGVSPLRVLQMTTSDAAEFLDAADSMGTVEAGKVADLVFLDADPLWSVQNLHKISGVARAGTYYAKADLEAIKERTAAARSVH